MQVGGAPVTTYAWGEGPAVLLVHGWSSHTGCMAGFVDPLLERGFRVVAFDAPAHGRIGLSDRVASDLGRRVAAFVGEGYYDRLWDSSPSSTLVLHDREDREIPWTEGRRVAD